MATSRCMLVLVKIHRPIEENPNPDQPELKIEELVDHSFRQGVLLILIAMGTYVVARLIYNFLNKKLIESRA